MDAILSISLSTFIPSFLALSTTASTMANFALILFDNSLFSSFSRSFFIAFNSSWASSNFFSSRRVWTAGIFFSTEETSSPSSLPCSIILTNSSLALSTLARECSSLRTVILISTSRPMPQASTNSSLSIFPRICSTTPSTSAVSTPASSSPEILVSILLI